MSRSDLGSSVATPVRESAYRNGGKRVLDVTIAAVLIILSAPLLAGLALAVRSTLGAPVLFRQPRAGRDGVAFQLCKLRTMTDARDPSGKPLEDEHRTTALGRFLRRTSLDELPELFHVLVGQMSLVGPRPLPLHYLPHYSAEQNRRHCLRPGITGWAQVCYPYGASLEDSIQKQEFDLFYIKNHSIFLDTMILCQTAEVVLFSKGAR